MSINVWLEHGCLLEMQTFVTRKLPQESGGVLMGYWGNPSEIVISKIIGPGPKAKHSRYSFTPDSEWQEHQISEVYNQSNRIITYLGDWHSHPAGEGELSSRDYRTLKRIASFGPARTIRPIMAILHGDLLLEIAIWCLIHRSWRAKTDVVRTQIRYFNSF